MKSGSCNDHRGSVLLKPDENEQVFRLIGNRCQTTKDVFVNREATCEFGQSPPPQIGKCLAAGAVQLYLTEPPYHKEWIKKDTGIMTLIKDNPKRSYFFRLYCPRRSAMLWEHEIYNSIDFKMPLPYFQTFEGEECMTAFNFANETDASIMRNVIMEKLNAKKQRRHDRRSRMSVDTQHGVTLPRKGSSTASQLGYNTGSTTSIPNGLSSSVGVNRSLSSGSMFMSKKKNRDKDKKKRKQLTANDIGHPLDFRHVAHMGWKPNSTGLELQSVDPQLKQFFDTAGVSESQLRDQETREFIYDFIETHGGLKAVQEAIVPSSAGLQSSHPPPPPPGLGSPPPVPARTVPVSPNLAAGSTTDHRHQARHVLPPPPSRTNFPPPPPNAPPAHRLLPSRPPAPSVPTPAPPPPPPPPPMVAPAPPPPPVPSFTEVDCETMNDDAASSNGEVGDVRNALMDAIRSGKTLKKVEMNEPKPNTTKDSRGDLLSQIRQGVELKSVANAPKPLVSPVAQDTLAGALTRALAERSRAIHSDSDDHTSDTSEDDDWED